MNNLADNRELETDTVLRTIVAAFEELGSAIDLAISVLESEQGSPADLDALRRAQEAAAKGAELARSKLGAGGRSA
jgi:hypothetical protein